MIKNIEKLSVQNYKNLIQVRDKCISSKVIAINESMNMIVFAFSKGEVISEEQYLDDVLYQSLEGVMIVKFEDKTIEIAEGDFTYVPAGVLHEIICPKENNLKMLQITIKK